MAFSLKAKNIVLGHSVVCKCLFLKFDALANRRVALLVLDTVFGALLTCMLDYALHGHVFDWNSATEIEAKWLSRQLNGLISWLQALIEWLMGNPAGLKLNKPLNQTLGHFFLYHIYLWKTYITFLRPALQSVLLALRRAAALGFALQTALVIDLVSVLTVHIYCFHVYAARLYQLQVAGLVSMWRLFRGKKFNPLRHRVDSAEFDAQQLLLGTLLFTVLLFLLPTVLVYYVVFSGLRLVVFSCQHLLECWANLILLLSRHLINEHTNDVDEQSSRVAEMGPEENLSIIVWERCKDAVMGRLI